MVVAAALFATVTSRVAAQDSGDVGAWFGMMLTPYGALPPLVTPAMFGGSSGNSRVGPSFEAKYGHWGLGDGEEPWNTFGLGARTGPIGFVVGYAKCEGCDDGAIMGGVEFERILVSAPLGAASPTSLALGLRPSVGYTKPMGDQEGSAVSAAIDLPVSLSASIGDGFRIAPFVTPGFGYGRMDDGEFKDSGTRASIAAGVGFLTRGGLALHVAWRKIIIDEGVSTFGVGMSLVR
jgi:hypothetical protein